MIGFITSTETAAAVLDGIREAQLGRGTAYYWTTGAMPIYSGDYAGQTFIPADDALLDTSLRQGLAPDDLPASDSPLDTSPRRMLTPRDFPEFDQLVALLGGLDARVDLPASDIIDPDSPED